MNPKNSLRKFILVLHIISSPIVSYPTIDRYLTELASPNPGWDWGIVAEQPYIRFDPTAMIYQVEDPSANYAFNGIKDFYPASVEKLKVGLPYSYPLKGKNTEYRADDFSLSEDQVQRIIRCILLVLFENENAILNNIKGSNKSDIISNLRKSSPLPDFVPQSAIFIAPPPYPYSVSPYDAPFSTGLPLLIAPPAPIPIFYEDSSSSSSNLIVLPNKYYQPTMVKPPTMAFEQPKPQASDKNSLVIENPKPADKTKPEVKLLDQVIDPIFEKQKSQQTYKQLEDMKVEQTLYPNAKSNNRSAILKHSPQPPIPLFARNNLVALPVIQPGKFADPQIHHKGRHKQKYRMIYHLQKNYTPIPDVPPVLL